MLKQVMNYYVVIFVFLTKVKVKKNTIFETKRRSNNEAQTVSQNKKKKKGAKRRRRQTKGSERVV